jgi:hypothetical protein
LAGSVNLLGDERDILGEVSRIDKCLFILCEWGILRVYQMDEKGSTLARTKLGVFGLGTFLGLIVFLVVFYVLTSNKVDSNLSAILAVVAGFGSFSVIARLLF